MTVYEKKDHNTIGFRTLSLVVKSMTKPYNVGIGFESNVTFLPFYLSSDYYETENLRRYNIKVNISVENILH